MRPDAVIERVEAAAYRIPTDRPEADGTYAWDSTTLVAVHVISGDVTGFGYSYGSAGMARLVRDQLAPRIVGLDALAVERAWNALGREVRNIGRPGIASTAISAVDAALWDLKAKLLALPLVRLLGDVRDQVPVYGSGGFTSYTLDELRSQLGGWAEMGISRVKMKVGARPQEDVARVAAAREAIGGGVELMVDANGGYRRKEALAKSEEFARSGVTWFEEPVSSDDLEGLRLLRERAPATVEIAAGEYGYDPSYFLRMLQAGAVDVLQADATRCLGITGFLAASRLCLAFGIPMSAHTAPSLHAHLGCAATPLIHVEYFHDHARIERMLFDGFVEPRDGALQPDRTRPGMGVTFKQADAKKYAIQEGT
jgi:L-alanine-DL-glutamate epimerase-like enolase superfamily enzyme